MLPEMCHLAQSKDSVKADTERPMTEASATECSHPKRGHDSCLVLVPPKTLRAHTSECWHGGAGFNVCFSEFWSCFGPSPFHVLILPI